MKEKAMIEKRLGNSAVTVFTVLLMCIVLLLPLSALGVVGSDGKQFIGEWEATYRLNEKLNVRVERGEQKGKLLVHMIEDDKEGAVYMTLGESGCLEYILDEEGAVYMTLGESGCLEYILDEDDEFNVGDDFRFCLNETAKALIIYRGAVKAIENGGKQFVGRWHEESDSASSLTIKQGDGNAFMLHMQDEKNQVSIVANLEKDSCLHYEAADETTATSFDKRLELCLSMRADLLEVRADQNQYSFIRASD